MADVKKSLRVLWTLIRTTVADLFTRFVHTVEDWLLGPKKARYGMAITRVLMGTAALGLLVSDFRGRYYHYGSAAAWNREVSVPTSKFAKISLFDLFRSLVLNDVWLTLIYLAVMVLAVLVILGWRTRIVLIVFFFAWVSLIAINRPYGNQGDNIMRIAFLLMIFADPAGVWSLDARRKRKQNRSEPTGSWFGNLLHNAAVALMIIQVCIVYVSGGLYKATGKPWQEGYAVYNPLNTVRYGPWPELNEMVSSSTLLILGAAWGSILLQVFFPMMLLNRITRVIALLGISGFHIGIAVLMGLAWFSLAMLAIDAMLIRDRTWQKIGGMLTALRKNPETLLPEPPPAAKLPLARRRT